MTEKLAVIFPGIGSTCDKPLLYYSGKMAVGLGYIDLDIRNLREVMKTVRQWIEA